MPVDYHKRGLCKWKGLSSLWTKQTKHAIYPTLVKVVCFGYICTCIHMYTHMTRVFLEVEKLTLNVTGKKQA